MTEHKQGCDALGGYGQGVGPCTCGGQAGGVLTPVAHVNLQTKSGCGDGITWTGWALPHGTPLFAASPAAAAGVPTDTTELQADACNRVHDILLSLVPSIAGEQCRRYILEGLALIDTWLGAAGWSPTYPRPVLAYSCKREAALGQPACIGWCGSAQHCGASFVSRSSPVAPAGAPTEERKRHPDTARLDWLLPNLHPANFGLDYDTEKLEDDHNTEWRVALDAEIAHGLNGSSARQGAEPDEQNPASLLSAGSQAEGAHQDASVHPAVSTSDVPVGVHSGQGGENAPSAEGCAWVLSAERFPEKDVEVLTYDASADSVFINQWCDLWEAPVSFSSQTICVGEGWQTGEHENITHWMPLPQPPKEQK